jgi:hypothetical protein
VVLPARPPDYLKLALSVFNIGPAVTAQLIGIGVGTRLFPPPGGCSRAFQECFLLPRPLPKKTITRGSYASKTIKVVFIKSLITHAPLASLFTKELNKASLLANRIRMP